MKKLSLNTIKYIILKLSLSAYFALAQTRGASKSIVDDTNQFKDTFSEWGSVATGTAFLISLTIAVISLLIPWQYFKQTIGRAAWASVATSLILFFVMSFFGNSVQKAVQSLFTCSFSMFGIGCSG
ncbi:MAG: hypothetical protein K2X69_01760 [Silvanigrellaceae bacterium]|nr:hypothetical protein [Silvanigrellaceae bacterium]